MLRKALLKRVVAKLEPKLNAPQVKALVYSILDKEEVLQENYSKKMKITDEQHQKLRTLFDRGPVKKIYTYSMDRFGFTLDFGLTDFRFDVDPSYLTVQKIKKD